MSQGRRYQSIYIMTLMMIIVLIIYLKYPIGVGYVKMKLFFWLFPFLVLGSTTVCTGVSSVVFLINEIIKNHMTEVQRCPLG